LSPCSLAGRFRGRPGFPRGPMIGGIASTSGRRCVASWALAGERRTDSGMPFRSTTRWYFEPGLPRSVGFGPDCSPPFWPARSGCRRLHGTSRWRPHRPTNSAVFRVAVPRPRLPANHAAAANKLSRSHSRVPLGGTARDSRCEAQRRSLRGRYGRQCEDGHLSAWPLPSAVMAQWLPKGRRGQGMRRSWPAIMPPRSGFATRS
jgi:hypothetical protein